MEITTIIQEDNIDGQNILNIEVTADSQDLEVHPDPLPRVIQWGQ